VLGSIEFPKNAGELSDADFKRLKEVATTAQVQLVSMPGARVLVAATAVKGDKPGLDHQRAALIRAYLMSNGLPPSDVILEVPRKLVLPSAPAQQVRLILLRPS
jgi:hypothetical protein